MAKIIDNGVDPHDIGMAIGVASDRVREEREYEQQVLSFLQNFEEQQKNLEKLQEEKTDKQLYADVFADIQKEVHNSNLQEDVALRDQIFAKYPNFFRMLDELPPELIKRIEETLV